MYTYIYILIYNLFVLNQLKGYVFLLEGKGRNPTNHHPDPKPQPGIAACSPPAPNGVPILLPAGFAHGRGGIRKLQLCDRAGNIENNKTGRAPWRARLLCDKYRRFPWHHRRLKLLTHPEHWRGNTLALELKPSQTPRGAGK